VNIAAKDTAYIIGTIKSKSYKFYKGTIKKLGARYFIILEFICNKWPKHFEVKIRKDRFKKYQKSPSQLNFRILISKSYNKNEDLWRSHFSKNESKNFMKQNLGWNEELCATVNVQLSPSSLDSKLFNPLNLEKKNKEIQKKIQHLNKNCILVGIGTIKKHKGRIFYCILLGHSLIVARSDEYKAKLNPKIKRQSTSRIRLTKKTIIRIFSEQPWAKDYDLEIHKIIFKNKCPYIIYSAVVHGEVIRDELRVSNYISKSRYKAPNRIPIKIKKINAAHDAMDNYLELQSCLKNKTVNKLEIKEEKLFIKITCTKHNKVKHFTAQTLNKFISDKKNYVCCKCRMPANGFYSIPELAGGRYKNVPLKFYIRKEFEAQDSPIWFNIGISKNYGKRYNDNSGIITCNHKESIVFEFKCVDWAILLEYIIKVNLGNHRMLPDCILSKHSPASGRKTECYSHEFLSQFYEILTPEELYRYAKKILDNYKELNYSLPKLTSNDSLVLKKVRTYIKKQMKMFNKA